MAHTRGSSSTRSVGLTEFEILKSAHKFLQDDTTATTSTVTWSEQLASKYYSSLYREFAVCDLKHYKSGNFALRWRTEDEVLSGAGESTCGNTRCRHHHPSSVSAGQESSRPQLSTLELPFGYVEHGEDKSALVKVVLCDRCCGKLMWKRRKQRELEATAERVELDDSHTVERGVTSERGHRKEKRKRSQSPRAHKRDNNGRQRRHSP